MKKVAGFWLVVIFSFIPSHASAQLYFGYSANRGDFEGVNESIDFWNSNFDLEEGFDELSYIHGFTLKYGGHLADGPLFGSLGNSFMIQKTSSTWISTNTGEMNQADIRYMRYSFQLGAGFRILGSDRKLEITPGINLGMDLIYLDYRFADQDVIEDEPWNKGIQELAWSQELFLQIDFPSLISIAPYMLFTGDLDTKIVDEELLTGKVNGSSGQNQVGVKFFLKF